jgi:hypothetical protein
VIRTTPIEATNDDSVDSEWRRLCHYFEAGADISACGTAVRHGEVHTEIECRQRGHTICVVCTEVWFSV